MLTQRLRDWLLPVVIGILLGAGYLLLTSLTSDRSTGHEPPSVISFSDPLSRVLPFAVSIVTTQSATETEEALNSDPYLKKYLEDADPDRSNLGSGIVLNPQGDVITNAHVIRGADDILILTQDERMVSVRQVFVDPETDIALLKTNLQSDQATPLSVESPRIGDIVFSIGNPFGVGQSVSMGIVSATGRAQPGLTQLTDYIQTDAAINPGNSGGPLVNVHGQVIGMNSALFSATGGNQGIGFAIPIRNVLAIVEELAEKGHIERGYLGIDVRQETTDAAISGDDAGTRLIIVSIDMDSPAAQAGLEVGDQLLSLNGTELTSRTQAARLISQMMPGKVTEVEVLRNQQSRLLTIRLGLRASESP